MHIVFDLVAVIIGVGLAFEISVGNKGITKVILALLSVVIIVAYPYLLLAGLIKMHGFMGKLLFYLSFLMSYCCAGVYLYEIIVGFRKEDGIK